MLVLNACGASKKEAQNPNSNCQELGDFEFGVGPQPIETPSQVEITQDQILVEKDLDKMNVKVFNFSHFPGEIKFTQGLVPLLDPIRNRGAVLRIVFVDDTPNKEELNESPLKYLGAFSDKDIEKYKNYINKLRENQIQVKEGPDESSDCSLEPLLGIRVVDTNADNVGMAFANYKTEPLTLTILVPLKDQDRGYDDLKVNNYRTIPLEIWKTGVSILNRFLHELKHAQDFAGYYTSFDDPKFKADFDMGLPHDERPGEKRAIEYAAEKIKSIQAGELPPIIIYDDKGEMLRMNTTLLAAA